tara:strand:- start:646 stop:1407 length:762 start_codon:yes stop_codon:yes gene_type:complete
MWRTMIGKVIILASIFNFLFTQEEFFITIPATSYSDWVYFSVEQNSVIQVEDPENSLEWDFAFQRKHIKTNSGLSGIGNGGAYVDSSMTWTDTWNNTNSIPESINWLEDVTLYDFYDLQTHTFVEGIKNPALNAWGWFNSTYQLVPTNYVMYAKCANGIDVVKFWAYDYYQNNAGGNVSLRYETGFAIPFECQGVSGDVNLDNLINVVDIVTLVGYVLGNSSLDECQLFYSDLNQDELINVVDIVNLVSLILN